MERADRYCKEETIDGATSNTRKMDGRFVPSQNSLTYQRLQSTDGSNGALKGELSSTSQGNQRIISEKKKIQRSIEDEICSLRKKRLWGPDKIKGYLSKKGIEGSQYMIYIVLKENGLNHALLKPRRKMPYIRWERDSPNDLWQCDWKYVKEENKWLIAYIDDHSRFVVSAKLYDSATEENALECLFSAIKRYGIPKEILTDHGTQFYSVRHGESAFDHKLKELGVTHILSGIGRPTTTGKIERFFATYMLEGWRYTLSNISFITTTI